MAILDNQSYECEYYLRVPNGYEADNLPVFFKAELVSDKEKTYNQSLSALMTPSVRLMLRTASKHIGGFSDGQEVKGYVKFQGDLYQVQSISYDMKSQNGLAVGKFSKAHAEMNAIKVLVLI